MESIELRDIKDIVEIPDYSLYILIALVVVGLVLLYFIVRTLMRVIRKPKTKKEAYLKKLKQIDIKQTKKTAYFITEASYVVCDSESKANVYKNLEPKLERYKYKKNVYAFDDETKKAISHFLEVVDE